MHSVISWCVDVRPDAHGVSCAPSHSCVCTWTRDVSNQAVFHPIRVPERGILIRSTAHELLKLTHGSGASLEEWEGSGCANDIDEPLSTRKVLKEWKHD